MVAIQMMRKQGHYPGGLAVAITAAASLLGPLIPPSIPMVLYAILISGASVGALFLAGIVPGLLMALSISILIALIAKRRGLPCGEPVPLRELPCVFGARGRADDAAGRAARRHLGRHLHADRSRRGRGVLGDPDRRASGTAISALAVAVSRYFAIRRGNPRS